MRSRRFPKKAPEKLQAFRKNVRHRRQHRKKRCRFISAVRSLPPGVYTLPGGSRVVQAVEAAGGFLPDAEEKILNLARKIEDGEQITVWTREEAENMEITETPQQNTGGTEQASGSGKVNLNTAGKEELMTLSGIGESRADAIIAYREANGPFGSVEEIMNIEGIKEKMFEKIRGSIEV